LSEPFTLEGKFQDDITPAIVVVRKSIEQVTDSTSKLYEVTGHENDAINESIRAFKAQQTGLQSLNDDLQKNINRLTDQKRFLSSSEYRQSAVDAEKLRLEVNLLTKEVQEEASAMVFAKNSATPLEREIESLNIQLGESITKLRAQKEVLQDPGYKARQAEVAGLKSEIAKMTESTVKNSAEQVGADAVEKGIFSNMRTRREALVMAHEAMMGRTKNLMGSAMVFAEYTNSSILESVTGMINPYTIAIAAMSAATIGLVHHYVELSEKAAETYHESAEMGERLGMTAEQMEGLDYATIGTKVKTEELARAISTFSVKLEQHRAQFAALGVTAQDPIHAFEQFIDAAGRAGTESERNRILEEGLGKTWQQVAPIVLQGGKALEDAIQKGKLPPEIKKDFEDMIQYQKLTAKAEWEADRAASQHAASIALENEKMKAGLAIMRERYGIVGGTVLYGLDVASSGMSEHKSKTFAETLAEEAAAKQKASSDSSKKTTSNTKSFTEEQQKILDEANKERATKSLSLSLQLIRDEYAGKISQFKKGSEEYNKVVEAESVALQAVRDRFAKKDKPKASKTEREVERNRKEIDNFIATNDSKLRAQEAYNVAYANLQKDAQDLGIKNGVSTEVATVQASADQQIAALASGYDKQRALKGATKEQIATLTRQEAAEEIEIQQKATEKILTIYAKSDSEKLRQDEKNRALTLKDLDKQAEEIKKASEKIAAINVSTGKELPGSLGKKDTSKYDLERQAIDQSAAERKRAISNEIKDEKQKAAALQAIEANSAAQKAKVDRAELEERKKNYEQYSSIVQSYAQGQLSSMLQGEFTLTKAKEAAKTAAINFVAEEATKRIASFVETLVFQKAESAVANAESIAQAQLTGAALAESYATAAALASIATMGAADVAGGAGLATTVAAAHTTTGFAGGGIQMGPAIVGERRAEVSTPTTPQRITQTSNSTVNSSVGGMTVNINAGASVDRVAGVLTRAGYRRTRGLQYSSR